MEDEYGKLYVRRSKPKRPTRITNNQKLILGKCGVCKGNVLKRGYKGSYPLLLQLVCWRGKYEEFANIKHKYFHAGCVNCLICHEKIHKKRSKIRQYDTYFCHEKCQRCICGFGFDNNDYVKWKLKDGNLVHRNCPYTYDNCKICNKIIGLEKKWPNAPPIHYNCMNGNLCYMCGDPVLSDHPTDYDFEKKLYKHELCLDKLCNSCMEPLRISGAHNFIIHLKCKKNRLVEKCNNCNKNIMFDGWSWFRNRIWSPKIHQYFSKEVKEEIKLFLLIINRNPIFGEGDDKNRLVPACFDKLVLYNICSYIATINGRKIIDNHIIYNVCTPLRCRDSIMCIRCNHVRDDYGKQREFICCDKSK